MRRERLVLALVLLCGYALYGGLFAVALGAHDGLSTGGQPAAVGNASPVETGTALSFSPVEDGLPYENVGETESFMGMVSNASIYSGDVDGDEFQELLAIGGPTPVLFANEGGRFVPSGALPPIDERVRSAAFLDFNADGREDILLLPDGAEPILLENVGGAFERRDRFDRPLSVPVGAAVADYDGDGCTDLFVYQNGDWGERHPHAFSNYSIPADGDNGNPNVLYRGTCGGFERVEDAGLSGEHWSLAASFVDLTGDGRPDVHVANDFAHDVVYRNEGDGSFERVVLQNRTNRNGMSSEVADVTGDGRLDVFVTNIFYPPWAARQLDSAISAKARGNNLITPLGTGTFVGRGEQFGVTRGGWGWAAVLADFDDDGDEDLFHTTSNVTVGSRYQFTSEQLRRLNDLPIYSRPAVFERTGPSWFTQRRAADVGFAADDGRGVTRLDFDRDGDQDLAVATTGGYRLYENTAAGGESLQLRVLDAAGGTALGATVRVSTPDGTQTRRIHGRTDYLSQDSRVAHVGVGNATVADVSVSWPDGTTLELADVAVGQRVVVGPDGVRSRHPHRGE